MKTTTVLCAIAATTCLSAAAFSQTTLDKAKIDGILKELTSRPRKTWISAGTIRGTHYERRDPVITDSAAIDTKAAEAVSDYEAGLTKSEGLTEPQELMLKAIPFNVKYRLANTYTMTSTEVVDYDGEHFRWEITIGSRADSVKPEATLAANPWIDAFQTDVNKHRVFTWDGQRYTTTCNGGETAVVDVDDRLPRSVNGPLTAGLIPWGHDKFSYDNLADADVLATNSFDDAVKTIHLSIAHSDGSSTEVNLDPAKNYAATSATLTASGGFQVRYRLSGYALFDGQWVPSSVVIERSNLAEENQAPTVERWSELKVVSTAAPALNRFAMDLAPNAVVEYLTPDAASSSVCVNSGEMDMDELLGERMAYRLGEGKRHQNCATVALQHVASQFGKPRPHVAATSLVNVGGVTNLYDLKQYARELGLYGSIVKTDVAGLRNLGTAKAILHFPGKGHFVVMDRIDNQYVWLVDLSNKTFYYRQDVSSLLLNWTEGTALLLSDQPIAGEFALIPDAASKEIDGGTYYYDCTYLMQEDDMVPCYSDGGVCQGLFIYRFERWGCARAESGTCPTQGMPFTQHSPCVPDPIFGCTITGVWTIKLLSACR
jgi:hypothetical protein